MHWGRNSTCVFALSSLCVTILIYCLSGFGSHFSIQFQMIGEEEVVKEICPGILHAMKSGTWKTRRMTSQEESEINRFYIESRDHLPNRTNYQRPDLKCGNVTYTGKDFLKWFRVLCNPRGSTPCCFNNRCVNKKVDECRGPMNFDLRSRIHAEYATWIPDDKRCSVKLFNSENACSLLKDSTIVVIGDSLMRQLFTALVMILKGDFKTGAFKPNTPKEMKQKCAGMYVFPHKDCRTFIDFKPTVCNGSLKLEFKHYPSTYANKNLKIDSMLLKRKKKSMIFVGIGSWDLYDYNRVINVYVSPTLRALERKANNSQMSDNNSQWPKILWSSVHSLGLWRYPAKKTMDNAHGRQFNEKLEAYLRYFNIPVFDTFHLTAGMMSIDGIHYGLGVNVLKAQLYLNYMQELKDKMKQKCAGMYVFPHKDCRTFIDFKPTVCNGSLKLEFKHYPSTYANKNLKIDSMLLKRKKKSMIFVGIGSWDLYDYNRVINVYVSPTLRALERKANNSQMSDNNSQWPKILWSSVHSLGLWRYPAKKTMDNAHGRQFNEKLEAYLRYFNIPVFDTFHLTAGMMSIDGIHYGLGVNVLKAQLYLNYMQELKDSKLWW